MSELINFIKENILSIGIIVVVVLLLLVIIELKDINLNPPKPDSTLVQQVTVETLANMDKTTSLSDSFCESYVGNSLELEGACNQLTKGNCATAKCCVYTGEKCVAGGPSGPTYKTDKDGKLITLDSYYYLGKCRGANCPT